MHNIIWPITNQRNRAQKEANIQQIINKTGKKEISSQLGTILEKNETNVPMYYLHLIKHI